MLNLNEHLAKSEIFVLFQVFQRSFRNTDERAAL